MRKQTTIVVTGALRVNVWKLVPQYDEGREEEWPIIVCCTVMYSLPQRQSLIICGNMCYFQWCIFYCRRRNKNFHIGLDKSGYPVNIFLISPRKHMLWRNKKNINAFWLKKRII